MIDRNYTCECCHRVSTPAARILFVHEWLCYQCWLEQIEQKKPG